MKKYFVVSDIHSYFDPLKEALDNSGFKLDNPDHILIVCGDIFDRGDQSLEVYNFLRNMPKEKRVLIRGNHEYLLRELVERDYPYQHDVSNGTLKTVYALNDKSETMYEEIMNNLVFRAPAYPSFKTIKNSPIMKEVIDWIFSDEWVDYYEVDKYIFVHSFIPLKNNSSVPMYEMIGNVHKFKSFINYNKNWRENATSDEWCDATWGCPFEYLDEGLFNEESKKGKILVSGHWHASLIHKHYEDIDNVHTMYISDHYIALDACTSVSKMINCLVFKI